MLSTLPATVAYIVLKIYSLFSSEILKLFVRRHCRNSVQGHGKSHSDVQTAHQGDYYLIDCVAVKVNLTIEYHYIERSQRVSELYITVLRNYITIIILLHLLSKNLTSRIH